ncbi:MAG: glycosyltransferase [Thiocapsa sp.]|uniref:glycosyltransferase n=1 Tax=Thiocapsa sp. TaxID=2024551 RepID=UPI001BCBE198|nr:glycosyltransferase [Thiocapsa sp.]QVL50325.1 MAG: glycosyltransferase [Thiocapsa sp.]
MLREDDPVLRTHNHFIEASSIASCLLERGYTVDFIDYRNPGFVPRKRYDLFVSARTNFERIARRLNPDCVKIVHLDTSHWLSNNHAALVRLRDVCNRRGVALSSYRPIEYNRGIEEADCATLLGNEVTHETYAFAGKTVFQIPNPGSTEYAWDDNKDFDACRNRFLWLGSAGFVHKGLDLALEAFARMPGLHLTVCGPIERDRHFEDAFRKELYETPNIHTHGWVDVTGAEFAALASRTIGHIYPTCAEGAAGAVVNCMHFGLVPITTPQAGVDVDPSFGLVLPELSVKAVQDAVRTIAGLPTDRLAAMARMSQSEARRVYSREHYEEVFGAVIDRILAVGPGNLVPGFVPMEALSASATHLGGSDLPSPDHA